MTPAIGRVIDGAQDRPIDWPAVKLVVFDLDGTLYRQRPVRLGMAQDLARHAIRTRSLRDVRLIQSYRKLREELAQSPAPDFLDELHDTLGQRHAMAPAAVAALAEDWLERRPLPRLAAARIAGAAELFTALRASGRRIGVWSDYPVATKLASLGLEADYTRAATDPDVRRLKPDPKGLEMMLEDAGAAPHQALMIGDRIERDGEAAARAGVPFVLRTTKPVAGYHCAADYRDPLFASVLTC